MAAYDGDQEILAPCIFAASPEKEHAAQCIAVETLRTLMDRGQSVKEWNDMPDAAWRGHALSSAARVPGHGLSVEDRISAASIGGCYFERDYDVLMATTSRPLVRFTRTGGIL